MLAADVPYLEVDGRVGRGERNGSDVLADGRHGFKVRVEGRVGCFYLFEERGFARVVKAQEQDRVFWGDGGELGGREEGFVEGCCGGIGEGRDVPSLLVACR